jgi:hypothetical protein
MGAGHYGVFNGSRFRAEIVPKIVAFMEAQAEPVAAATPIKLRHSVPAQAAESDLEIPVALIAHGVLAAGAVAPELHA